MVGCQSYGRIGFISSRFNSLDASSITADLHNYIPFSIYNNGRYSIAFRAAGLHSSLSHFHCKLRR